MTKLPSMEPLDEYWQQLAAHAPAENELRDALIKFRETLKADNISHHRVAIGILERQMSDVLAKLNAADAEFLHLRETLGPDDARIKELRSHRFHLSVESLRLRASIRKLENYDEAASPTDRQGRGWNDDYTFPKVVPYVKTDADIEEERRLRIVDTIMLENHLKLLEELKEHRRGAL